MNFLLQSDNVMLVEKRTITHIAALRDYTIKRTSLKDVMDGNVPGGHYTPVGTVEFTKAYAKLLGVNSIERVLSYPKELGEFFNRTIRLDNFARTKTSRICKTSDNKAVHWWYKERSR